jgi:hypothetical protein
MKMEPPRWQSVGGTLRVLLSSRTPTRFVIGLLLHLVKILPPPSLLCWHPTLRPPFSRRTRIQIAKKDTPKMSGQFMASTTPPPPSSHMPTHQTLITISFSVDTISRFTLSTSWSSRRSSCPDVMGILLRQIASELRDEDRRKTTTRTDVAGSVRMIAFWRTGSRVFWASLNVIL